MLRNSPSTITAQFKFQNWELRVDLGATNKEYELKKDHFTEKWMHNEVFILLSKFSSLHRYQLFFLKNDKDGRAHSKQLVKTYLSFEII